MFSHHITLYLIKRPPQIPYCLSAHKEAVTHIKTPLQFSIIVMHIYYVYSGWQTPMHDSIHLCFMQIELGVRWIYVEKKLSQMCKKKKIMLNWNNR